MAQTQRHRHECQRGEGWTQAGGRTPHTGARGAPKRQRAHPEMLTAPMRGPLVAKMRELAETTGMSLAKLLGDMVLVYAGEVRSGYGAETSPADWTAQQRV